MIGHRLHNYKVEKLLDEGGMGTVYLGVHMHLGRKVAIKALNPMLLKNVEIRERFKNEAITLSKLNHPNIVALYDYIERTDGVFIIIEYVEGQTLDDYINKISGPISEARAVKLFIKILDAIAYIHSKNVIHRDIKPSNFIITATDDIKLLDFGISKILDNEPNHHLTKDGSKVGTTLYMSPQQVKGQMVDRRTDIYSLGVTLYQMLTGRYPYDENSSEYDIYSKIVNDPLPDPKTFYIGISDPIRDVLKKATAKKPYDRYQACEEFSAALLMLNEKNTEPSLFLKTKILEVAEIKIKNPIFNPSFWRSLILIVLTLSFISAIIIVIFNIQKNDIRHVLADKLQLSAVDSVQAEKIETLNYGETVTVIKTNPKPDKKGIIWLHVISLRGNVGYVPRDEVALPKTYEQINVIFGNNYAQQQTPVTFKWALRKFFAENQLLTKLKPTWKLFAEPKRDFEYNSIAEGDFNNNGVNDFACVLKNTTSKKTELLIILDNKVEHILIEFDELVKIKPISKGKEGGVWFLGNHQTREGENGAPIASNKYENLPADAILLFKADTKENIIYIYSKEESKINFYIQPK